MIRRARSWSLANRLAWRLAAVMLAAVLLAAAAIAWRAVATVHELDDSALTSQADLVVASLPKVAGAAVALPESLLATYRASEGDNAFLVFDGDRLVVASDPTAAKLLLPPARPFEAGFFRLPPSSGHEHGMVGLVAFAGRFRVLVLQGNEQSEALLSSLIGNFLAAGLWLVLPIGIATVLVGVLTLRRGLRPLTDVSAAAARVGPGRPSARLPIKGLPSEVTPIVFAVNEALTRLEQALVAQRHFVAEAAHALRTPLAVLTARLDMQASNPGIEAARADTDRMARLVGQLLRMARIEGLPLDLTEPVDLHAIAVEAIASLVPLGLRRGIEIALEEGGVVDTVRGNPAALVVALTNLVENALSHAPAASTVEVTIAGPATLTVLDRGPGVAPEHRTRIFGRFERGPKRPLGTDDPGEGAGLGLAIVAEIAAAHGGSVRVEPRAGGGAAFVFELPGLPGPRRAAISPAYPDAVVAEW